MMARRLAGRARRRVRAIAALCVFHASVSAANAYRVVDAPPPQRDETFRWSAYRSYSSSDGLPANAIHALIQDADGFVYAGTESGLARFDGRVWRRVDLPIENQNSMVLKLAHTSDGAIWIGTDDHGLFRRSGNGDIAPVALPAESKEKDIEALIAADASSVYAGTSHSLYRCDAQHCAEIAAARGLEIATLLSGDAGNGPCIWIGTNLSGVFRIDHLDTPTPVRSDWHLGSAELHADAVRALAQWNGNDGKDLWVGTGLNLARVQHDQVTLYTAPGNQWAGGALALWPGHNARGESVLFAGLTGDGIAEIRLDGTWNIDGHDAGVPEGTIYDLLQTDADLRTPVLWLALEHGGVARREVGVWSTFDERNGLPNHAVASIGAIANGHSQQPWIGTAGGAVIWRNNAWTSWLPVPYAHSVLNDVESDGDDHWLATDDGLLRFTRRGVENISAHNAAFPGGIADVLEYEAPDSLWVGTHHGLVRVRVRGGRAERIPVPPLGDEDPVSAIVTTKTSNGQRLWIAGLAGVAYRDGEHWYSLPESCTARSDTTYDLREHGSVGAAHELWIAHRTGVTIVDLDHGLTCLELPIPGVAGEPVSQVQFDHDDRAYLFGHRGILRLTRDVNTPSDPTRMKVEHFGFDDGLPSLEFNRGSFVDDDGRIWAATIQGAVLYDPREEVPPPSSRPFRLLSARIEGTSKALVPNASLDADENNLVFAFSLLSYQRDKRTRYSTELVGSDELRSPWSAQGERVYRRLPPGEYTFHAYARDGFGIEAEPISLHFSIVPPLWLRRWALALYAAALLAILLGLIRWRVQRVQRVAAALERTVGERTASLQVANAQLEDARHAAEAATQAKSVFLANMSHEIRTPMNAVLGFAGLGMRLDISTKALEYFRKINNSGQNLLNILNDILDFSKIEAGKLALETVPFALSDVLAQVSDLFALRASEKGLEFVVGTAPDVPDHYIGDPLRLGQVLLNLVNNAIKFTRAGFVQLYVERAEPTRGNGKTLLRFCVEDSGIGMSESQMAHLFQPFSQADHSTTRTFGGTGLGLTISQRLVAQMGGAITVRSHPGAGSCFQFEIGLKVQATSPPHRVPPDAVQGCRILVVDDSAQARTWLCDQLAALRFHVHCVDCGEAALRALRAERFDVILMDWMMPGIDGIETTRRIRSDLGLGAIPEVIMVTAHGRESIKDAAESVGIQRFLIKPVDASVLLDTILDVLGADSMRTKSQIESGQASAALTGVRVLLAEDNPINQQLAIEMLDSVGIAVDVANNGVDALQRAEERAYDAILMDIEMPEMDGYTAARLLRERSPDGPPIIAMTAHATVDHRRRCLEAGMVDVVTKPVLFDELIDALRQHARILPTPAVATSAPAGNDVFDARTAIARMNGNAALFRKLVTMFPDLHRTASADVDAALSQNDVRKVARIAHSVGGAAGNLAAMRLHAAAMALENAAEHGHPSESLIREFDAALNEMLAACAAYLAGT